MLRVRSLKKLSYRILYSFIKDHGYLTFEGVLAFLEAIQDIFPVLVIGEFTLQLFYEGSEPFFLPIDGALQIDLHIRSTY